MSAKYYRFLYHPVSRGMCFSASIGAEKGKDGIQLMYVSGLGEDSLPKSAHTEHLHFLILGDLEARTAAQAEEFLKNCRVDTVFIPGRESQPSFLAREGVRIREISETHEEDLPGFRLKLFCGGEKLIAFLGSRDTDPAKEICRMNVKPCTPQLPCSLTVDAANLRCEMQCMLSADHTQCKRHHQRNETYFVDGHLLIGTADVSGRHTKLKEYLAAEWKTIRCASLPDGIDEEDVKSLADIGTDGSRRYFIGGAGTPGAAAKTLGSMDAFRTVIFTGEKAGLCISGCYEKRQTV